MTTTTPIATGVPGLDALIGGGFPPGRAYLIAGRAGTGKTTIALQFLRAGLRAGEPGLYISLSETRQEIVEVAASHGWTLDDLALVEMSAIEDQLKPRSQTTTFHPSELFLARTVDRVVAEIDRVRPKRVVFDSLAELRLLAQDPLRYRRQLLSLKQKLVELDATLLLLDDDDGSGAQRDIDSLVHGVIRLDREASQFGADRRRLTIDKMRAVKFQDGHHDYAIRTGGVAVFPHLSPIGAPIAKPRELLQTGIPELDAMLGGGIRRGSSLLLIGAAGTGKSSITTCCICEAARRGEKSVVWTFDESAETYIERASGLSLDVASRIRDGLFEVRSIDPARLSPGEVAQQIQADVEERGVTLIVLDSLSGYLNAMPEEKHLRLHLHEVLAYLDRRGVVAILTLAQQGIVGPLQSADVSYLADAVVLLRYFEARGAVKKAISVIKKRTGGHEDTIREFSLTGGVVRIGEPLCDFEGVLTGTPVYRGRAKALMEPTS